MTTNSIEEFVRRGVAAQEAADRAAGRLTAAERDREDGITMLRARLHNELAEALAATRRAARTFAELASPSVYDLEYAESDAGRDVEHFLESARRSIAAARAQSAQFSLPVR